MQRHGARSFRVAGLILSAILPRMKGSSTVAYGVYHIENLAAYEAYRARLAADPAGRENYAFAKREQFIRREDRMFLKLASAPHSALVRPRSQSFSRLHPRRDNATPTWILLPA